MLRDAQEAASKLEHSELETRDPSFAVRFLALAMLRLGRRVDAEQHLATVLSEAEQRGLRMSIHSALLLRSALATATGRFVEGKELATEAARQAGRHIDHVEIGYVVQVLTGRMERGELDDVADELGTMLDRFDFELPGYRAMRAGALAEAGRLAEAERELQRIGRGAPSDEVGRLVRHAPMVIRHVSELCLRLSDHERAEKLLAQVTPWSGQILVGGWGQTVLGASDRAIGHLLTTVGRYDEADEAYAAATELEHAADFPPLVARTRYWHARTLLHRDAAGDRQHARALLDDVVDVTEQLGMSALRRQALSTADQVSRPS
jgi:tetratricopeptide (TPR) repeat protein